MYKRGIRDGFKSGSQIVHISFETGVTHAERRDGGKSPLKRKRKESERAHVSKDIIMTTETKLQGITCRILYLIESGQTRGEGVCTPFLFANVLLVIYALFLYVHGPYFQDYIPTFGRADSTKDCRQKIRRYSSASQFLSDWALWRSLAHKETKWDSHWSVKLPFYSMTTA